MCSVYYRCTSFFGRAFHCTYFLIITVVTYLLYLHLLDRGDLSLSLTGEESLSVRALPQSAILAQHFPVLKRMMALPSFSIGPASF